MATWGVRGHCVSVCDNKANAISCAGRQLRLRCLSGLAHPWYFSVLTVVSPAMSTLMCIEISLHVSFFPVPN